MSSFIEKQGSNRLGLSANITVTSSTIAATVSSAFGGQTRQVRVTYRSAVAGDAASISIDDGTPTISSSSAVMLAQWTEYFTVNPGQKIAVTGATTTSVGI